MDDRIKIGRRISQLRKERGLSQEKLADISGVTWANISRIELGKYSVGIDVLSKIANALDCEIDFVPKS